MERHLTHQVTQYVAAFGAALVAAAWLVGGTEPMLGAAAGALVSVANWLALRWLALRAARGGDAARSRVMLLIAVKMTVLVALCWFLVGRAGVHPIGFTVGLGALILGIAVAAARAAGAAIRTGEEG